jgi:cytochrome c peroxidase
MRSALYEACKSGLALFLALTLVVTLTPPPVMAQGPGSIKTNGSSSGIPAAGFLFEPEVPFTSLKNVPTWAELEQLLDNPYVVTLDPSTPGNDQGFPSYRATGVIRRPGFGVTLPSLLVHPLNYNTTTGEEMRLLNPKYPGGPFFVTNQLIEGPPGTFTWARTPATISPGADRVTETSIDYNNPIGADLSVCVLVTEANPPEGSMLCGGDPGEPNYGGFGFRVGSAGSPTGYSTPAVPLNSLPAFARNPGVNVQSLRLYDPAGCAERNAESPGSCTGQGVVQRLRKPTLRLRPNGADLDYVQNSDPNNVKHSNENDYIRGNNPTARRQNRNFAIALGKALFWDMQVGSDSIQSCGTCHFNGTGTDTRTKNQINPNHLGGDNTFQLMQPNARDLVASDFPLHKLGDPDVAGDPACGSPITADASTIPYDPQVAGYLGTQRFSNPVTGSVTVCDAGNIQSDVNDVVSSMGVHWGVFKDIQLGLGTLSNGVGSAKPDLRETAGDCALAADPAACMANISDPIAGFAGASGTDPGVLNQFRRVEPRNTPTMQAAGFNFDNFWDGRARHDFNGGSVFGAADPQTHVFVDPGTGTLTPTRQIIRFTSLASLATGPGLSEFEMSYLGRNWSKVGKKLLQGHLNAGGFVVGDVTPLANQLVDPTDSVLGQFSNNQSSSFACSSLQARDRSPGTPAVGKPGLCISYPGLIRNAFEPQLWRNTTGQHLNGCYTDGRTEIHTQCSAAGVTVAIPVLNHPAPGVDTPGVSAADPFDGYVLSIANGSANPANTNEFTQMEGNFSLFWGLAIQSWVNILVPDNTPFDQFLDANPGAFLALGEPGEPGLVADLLNCGQAGADPNYCFTPVGNFKRDPGVVALQAPAGEGGAGGILVVSGGNRGPSAPDPLLGLDIFFASNLSLKNPNFRTGRCGECHAIPTLTDHTMPFTSKINLMDAVAEFATPGIELVVEPLARLRVISGFLLESEINENGQDAVERRIVNQSLVPNPVDGLAYPGATAEGTGLPGVLGGPWTGADSAFLDNGMYNLGVRPISEDIGRGGNDAFGWPLSLSALMMKNLGGPDYNPGGDNQGDGFAQPAAPGIAMSTFDPNDLSSVFEETAQDQQINPGYDGEPADPQLPPYLGAFANNITVGDFPPEMDEAGGAIGGMINTLSDVAMIEGFMDTLGPFNPGNISAEVLNFGGFSTRPGDQQDQMGTWPNVNRVGRMGSFKAPQLRNVELTGPYFHNGGKLTLRQVVDFYTRGGDFPMTNAAHRDFNLVNMNIEIQSNLSEAEKVSLVDFLLELTDERNRHDMAPFDHPEVIVPVDGLAPENRNGATTLGRTALLANPMFRSVPAVGAAGGPAEEAFLGVVRGDRNNPNCSGDTGISHYCH